jgi:AraC-like DNA-binding protein
MKTFNLAKNDQAWVLIIEKNESINSIISPSFKTEIARDQVDALQKLRTPYPRNILCHLDDELTVTQEICKALRLQRRISHIPIILMAQGTVTEKTINLMCSVGATTVVPCSTSNRSLTLRINRLSEIYQYSFIPSAFLKEVNKHIAANINRRDFTVSELAASMKVNRKTLYCRILRETGLTAQLYIREIRIRRAGHLLYRSGAEVSEVCFAVGMPDQSYFSKCFKGFFNQTPRDFVEVARKKRSQD